MRDTLTIGLGGGCHWCTEAVFQALRGVTDVAQGFVRAPPPDDAWSEAALVTFDPAILPLDALLEIHLRTHASTSAHALRGKYRSAVYLADPSDRADVERALSLLAPGFDAPLVTRVLDLAAFKPSDPRFQNYYATDPDRPFCIAYIEPKLRLLRERFGAFSRAGSETADRV